LSNRSEVALNVEIWSDIACPWCYIGKRRFEAALSAFEHRDEVRVTWRSFELDPHAPPQREGDRAAHLAERYGTSREQAVAMQAHITEVASAEGLDFRFDIARAGNTFDAHRLVHLAAVHGCQDALEERLFRAYFTEGEVMADHDALERLGLEIGLAGDEIRHVLAGNRYAAEVREDERTAAALGINAVPFFVADRAMGVSGAQPPDVLRSFLERGWAQRPALSVIAQGESAAADGY
jgi:predicted DsbA family dithiol-disulfide isomerase